MNIQFKKIDQAWFSQLYDKYHDKKLGFGCSIDLTRIDFISFFDIINLFLAIDYFQGVCKHLIVNFYGIGPYAENNIIQTGQPKMKKVKQQLRLRVNNWMLQLTEFQSEMRMIIS